MIKIGVTGGIGCGKSTVCRLFQQKGVAIYDSDHEAKRLMTEDEALRRQLIETFGADIYIGEQLDRKALASRVFGCEAALKQLNAMVHPVVRADFRRWSSAQTSDYVVLESAILFDAGFEDEVDHTIAVMAPVALRVDRAARRDHCPQEQIRKRIEVQMSDDELRERAEFAVVNILESDLAAAVDYFDGVFRHEAILAKEQEALAQDEDSKEA